MFTISNVLPHKPTSHEDFLGEWREGTNEVARGSDGRDLFGRLLEGGHGRPARGFMVTILKRRNFVNLGNSFDRDESCWDVWWTWLVFVGVSTLVRRILCTIALVYNGAAIRLSPTEGRVRFSLQRSMGRSIDALSSDRILVARHLLLVPSPLGSSH